jgi:hypothetical protein
LDELVVFAAGGVLVAADDPAVCSLAMSSNLEVLFEGALGTPEVAVMSDELLFVDGFEPLDDDCSVADAPQAMFSCESLPVRAAILDMTSRVPNGQKRAGLNADSNSVTPRSRRCPPKVEILAFIKFIGGTGYYCGSV